jgi:hypothetical protein
MGHRLSFRVTGGAWRSPLAYGRPAVSLACGLLLAACGASAGDGTPPATVSPAPTATLSTPGTERITSVVLGDGGFPAYSVAVPVGWSSNGGFVINQSTGVMGVSVWDVTKVPSDPCHWADTLADPGPSVDDLVRALVAQESRNATTPTDVTLAGHSGVYLEWSVPKDAVVTGDADFDGCDVVPENGHRDFISWLSSSGGSRYQQHAGQVDWLWILDVNGQRLVVDATHLADETEANRAELRQVVESLRFEAP